MRPTLNQVVCNPKRFIELLTAAGVEHAHEKVTHLAYLINELNSLRVWIKTTEADLRYDKQAPFRYPSKRTTHKEAMLRRIKRSAPTFHRLVFYQNKAAELERRVQRKLDKWPELEFDPARLRKQVDRAAMSKMQSRRTQRKRHYRKMLRLKAQNQA